MATDTAALRGGFSFRSNVVGKPPASALQGLMLGDQWQWAEGAQPQHLLNALTQRGFAVTPARWADGYKSKKKGKFLESSYLLLDFDANLSWDQAKVHPFIRDNAAFLYTSASHRKPGKGDRFRVVFALDCVVTDHEVFDRLIQGMHILCPGSDPAINAASLLYGNPDAEVHIFNDLKNRVKTQDVYFHWALHDAQRKLTRQSVVAANGGALNYSVDSQASRQRVRGWLKSIPNTARDTWVRVCACLRNIEASGYDWAFDVFEEWSARDYADFDPHACQSLWESFEANPGGFRRLKDYFLYFQQHPEQDEYVPSLVNNINAVGVTRNGNDYQL